MDYFNLKLCGLTKKLPVSSVGKTTKLAAFSLLGDTKLIEKIADALNKKITKLQFDYFVAPEVKIVPLIYELAKRSKHESFIICRKSVKPYMVNPIILKPLPYFPKHVKPLVINGNDAVKLKAKKIIIIDDVVSTGVTMHMMEKLMKDIGAKTIAMIAVLKQGKQFEDIKDLIYLEEIPIFKT